MTGTPVCIGQVQARVCVAQDIQEAESIQVSEYLQVISLFC